MLRLSCAFISREARQVLEISLLNIYYETVHNHEYIMTVDVSKGRGQDYSTFSVFDISTSPFSTGCGVSEQYYLSNTLP